MDYSKFISRMSLNRKPSGISEMRSHLDEPSPSLVWLASGMPNPSMFPFRDASVTLQDGQVLTIPQELLAVGLQYGPTPGYVPLVKQLKTMVKQVHSPPRWADSDLLVTVGCQDGLAKAIEMILDPGDYVIVQEPCYSDALCILAALTPRYITISADDKGMCPDHLRKALEATAQSGEGTPPKLMYLVPSACNPTGTTMDEERRRAIYSVASEFNLIILEDDPYYYLKFEEKEAPPSFLSLDVDGRVIRFDSFSKIVSSGLRVGYVTGPKPLLERMNWHMQASVLCPPGISQILVSELLDKWGEEGFKNHIKTLRQFYRNQRDKMLEAADAHLTGLCEWSVPAGGIFLWFKVPGVHDTGPMLVKRAIKKDVVLVPGNHFMTDSSKPCQYMRAAFSCATPEEMMTGMQNLAELIQEEIALQNSQD